MEKYLAHHGVKGQKHGLRLFQYKDGTRTPLGKLMRRVQNADGTRTLVGRLRNSKGMSNDELKALTDRVNAERNYESAKESLYSTKHPLSSKIKSKLTEKAAERIADKTVDFIFGEKKKDKNKNKNNDNHRNDDDDDDDDDEMDSLLRHASTVPDEITRHLASTVAARSISGRRVRHNR